MKTRSMQLTALLFSFALAGAIGCSGEQGCGGTGDGSQYCGSGTRWDGTQCVK